MCLPYLSYSADDFPWTDEWLTPALPVFILVFIVGWHGDNLSEGHAAISNHAGQCDDKKSYGTAISFFLAQYYW